MAAVLPPAGFPSSPSGSLWKYDVTNDWWVNDKTGQVFDPSQQNDPSPVMPTSTSPCKHLTARINATHRFGSVVCPDCGNDVQIYQVFNNWLDEMQAQWEELQDAKRQLFDELTKQQGVTHGKNSSTTKGGSGTPQG